MSAVDGARSGGVGRTALEEPDWRRLPGFRDVTNTMWNDARWQRRNSARSPADLRYVFGSALPERLAQEIADDQRTVATMRLLIPPQVLNTMDERDLWRDPIRRYMAPASGDRHPTPSHPRARRDSLDEAGSWTVEGLVHRYPRKVMLELTTTCPQYCGHCTRMDLVGPSTSLIAKRSFYVRRAERYGQMLAYLSEHAEIHDVVISGGDVANVPIARLEQFVSRLLCIDHIRSIRLASKTLVTMPQHFLDAEIAATFARLAATARHREVDLALHTQANHASQVTKLVADAAASLLDHGFRDVRNQGVLLRGVNATSTDVLTLCERLLDGARIMPYYLYLCDIVPNAEHWRISVSHGQLLQQSLMGKLPGFAIPRVVCDVPFVGKRLIGQPVAYDRERGISWWRRSSGARRAATTTAPAGEQDFPYFDPIYTLPEGGQHWWRDQSDGVLPIPETP